MKADKTMLLASTLTSAVVSAVVVGSTMMTSNAAKMEPQSTYVLYDTDPIELPQTATTSWRKWVKATMPATSPSDISSIVCEEGRRQQTYCEVTERKVMGATAAVVANEGGQDLRVDRDTISPDGSEGTVERVSGRRMLTPAEVADVRTLVKETMQVQPSGLRGVHIKRKGGVYSGVATILTRMTPQERLACLRERTCRSAGGPPPR